MNFYKKNYLWIIIICKLVIIVNIYLIIYKFNFVNKNYKNYKMKKLNIYYEI